MGYDLDFDRYYTNVGIYREYTDSSGADNNVQSEPVFRVPHDWRVRINFMRVTVTNGAVFETLLCYPWWWITDGSTIGLWMTDYLCNITAGTACFIGGSYVISGGIVSNNWLYPGDEVRVMTSDEGVDGQVKLWISLEGRPILHNSRGFDHSRDLRLPE